MLLPSGTATVFVWKLKVVLLLPFELLEVKVQRPGVGSKPLPLSVPTPEIFRKVLDWVTTTDEFKLKVKPPTLQSEGVGVEGLKIQGAMTEWVPMAMLEKSAVSRVTKEVFQLVTRVAVASDMVSNVTTPLKSISPTMGRAWAWGRSQGPRRTRTRSRSDGGRNFIGCTFTPCLALSLDASGGSFFEVFPLA